MSQFDFSRFSFHPAIKLEPGYEIYDFSQGYDPNRSRASLYGVGKYDEQRPTMYATELFKKTGEEPRDVHVGIDLAAPEGSEVYSVYEGIVHSTAINSAEGDYGGTIVIEYSLGDRKLWALYGHLSHRSTTHVTKGQRVAKGEVIGWLGDQKENGGWNPHLHFQLSWIEPQKCDMPGAVRASDRANALRIYPDPRLVLGPLY